MPSIAILPADVADQIAAGEVVERPASVVKELVENALDAGATSVEVELGEGGRARVRVVDDGCGMDRDDALLSLERHGTSKIRSAADLISVSSFGFRGEALPAIASVSDLTIETASADGGGTAVRVSSGRVVDVGEVARRRGTTVTVARLFHNVPARLKFLRAAKSEYRAAMDALVSIAIARLDVGIMVTHDGKTALQLAPANSLRSRIAGIWGASYADALVAVDAVTGPVHVRGLAEKPADVGTAGRRVFLSVNGRAVRDAGLVRAAESAYRSAIPSGVRPSLFLSVIVPADTVDVNVHPAKAEVRFRDRWPVERAVEGAVRRALGTWDSAADLGASPQRSFPYGTSTRNFAPEITSLSPGGPPPEGLFADAQTDGAVQIPEESAPRLVQLRKTYMMFEHDDGLVLIDQHSAHERVIFERLSRQLESGGVPSQRLLFPLTLTLVAGEAEAMEEHRADLERVGFEVEDFGGSSIVVHAVPAPHPRFDSARCLRDTLSALAGDRAAGGAGKHERLLATIACKGAVKAGDPLSDDEMRALFLELRRAELPAHDVHGRSTIVHLSWAELERRFGRR